MSNEATALTVHEGGDSELAQAIPGQAIIYKDMDQIMRGAELMASATNVVPKHLLGNAGSCMAIIMQAQRWGLDCFAVAQKTHVINGVLGYEAQLVNAVVQTSGQIVGRFHYEYKGEGNNLECRVGAVLRGEREITWGEWLSVASVTTKNSPLWKTNPKQQIGYLQVKNWSRQYCPAAILGVYTPEELAESNNEPRDMGTAERFDDEAEKPASRTSAVSKKLNRSKPDQEKPADEKPSPALVNETDIEALRTAMKVADVSEAAFCAMAKIEKIEDLPLNRVAGANDWLKAQAAGQDAPSQ